MLQPSGAVIKGRKMPELLKLSNVSTTTTLTPNDSVTCCQSPFSLAVSSSVLPLVRSYKPRRRMNTTVVLEALFYLKLKKKTLADFDKLISEQMDKTRLMRVITNNMAFLPRTDFCDNRMDWRIFTPVSV